MKNPSVVYQHARELLIEGITPKDVISETGLSEAVVRGIYGAIIKNQNLQQKSTQIGTARKLLEEGIEIGGVVSITGLSRSVVCGISGGIVKSSPSVLSSFTKPNYAYCIRVRDVEILTSETNLIERLLGISQLSHIPPSIKRYIPEYEEVQQKKAWITSKTSKIIPKEHDVLGVLDSNQKEMLDNIEKSLNAQEKQKIESTRGY